MTLKKNHTGETSYIFTLLLLFSHGLKVIYNIDTSVSERTLYLADFLHKSYLYFLGNPSGVEDWTIFKLFSTLRKKQRKDQEICCSFSCATPQCVGTCDHNVFIIRSMCSAHLCLPPKKSFAPKFKKYFP